MPPLSDDPSHSPAQSLSALPARAAHREQVWAALIRAVDFLLEEAVGQIEDDLRRAHRNDDVEWTDRLLGRARVLKELRREVSSPPP